MEAVFSSETPIDFLQTTRRYLQSYVKYISFYYMKAFSTNFQNKGKENDMGDMNKISFQNIMFSKNTTDSS